MASQPAKNFLHFFWREVGSVETPDSFMDMSETTTTARPTIMTAGVDEHTTRKVTAIALGTLLQVPNYDGIEEMNRATADEADYIVCPQVSAGYEHLVVLSAGESVTVETGYQKGQAFGIRIVHSNGDVTWSDGYARITVR